jgi:hypothetical protein
VAHGDVTIGQKIDQWSRGVIITSTKGIIEIGKKGDQHSQGTLTAATTVPYITVALSIQLSLASIRGCPEGSLANSGYARFMASNSSSATLAATAFGVICAFSRVGG